MVSLRNWITSKLQTFYFTLRLDFCPWPPIVKAILLIMWFVLILLAIQIGFHVGSSYANTSTHLPGEDASGQLEAAGILLKTLDTGIFKWGAKIFAGLCIMSSAWALKEQRFGIAIICVIGAIIFGTASKWVQNIFDVGGNQGLFSQLAPKPGTELFASVDPSGVKYV